MPKRRPPRSTTIAVMDRAGDQARKITKIVPYKEGGFGVLLPYHGAQKGYLAKHQVDYRESGMRVQRAEMVEYSASDRVKLSFHRDGFVQFSGENPKRIISGRDQESGEPKGLGLLLEHPLHQPIRSGPTFGMTVWGLNEFEPLEEPEGSDVVVFTEGDFYYRWCTPSTWNAYVIEVFILPRRYWAGIRSRGGRLVLSAAFGSFEAGGAVLEFAVVPLPNQPILLAFMCSRLRANLGSPSGFALSSPSDRRKEQPIANTLIAVYPAPMEDLPANCLDYQGSDEAS